MEGMFKGTSLLELYLNQDPQAALKNKMGNFNKTDLQRAYAQAQGKYDETVNVAIISCQTVRKIQARTKTESPPCLSISPAKDTSITPGIIQESDEDEDSSQLGGASLDIDQAG